MYKAIVAGGAGILLATTGSAQETAVIEAEATVEIEAAEDEAGTWTVTYRFSEPQETLVLSQSPVTYREWQPLTDGVSMWRIGGMEGFAFAEPAREASFTITPYSKNLPAAYTPFLAFSDGGYGVLTDQFRVKPIADLGEAVQFEGSGEDWDKPVIASTVTLRSARTILSSEGATQSLTLDGGKPNYIYVGELTPAEGDSYRGIIDPGLPQWVSDGFDGDLGTIFSHLSDGWGSKLEEKATLFLVYMGDEIEGLDMTGGAIGSLLSLEIGGTDLAEPIPEIRTYLRWFLAHEAAHIYQQSRGNAGILMGGDGGTHSWVHEGSANTFSYRIGADMSDDPEGFLKESYASEYADCVAHLGEAPLTSAREMGNFRAYYACGDLIALATDAMLPDHDLYDFWVALQDESLKVEDTDRAQLYFALLEKLGADPDKIALLREFVFDKPDDAEGFVVSAMNSFGLPIVLDEDGAFAGLQMRATSDRKSLH